MRGIFSSSQTSYIFAISLSHNSPGASGQAGQALLVALLVCLMLQPLVADKEMPVGHRKRSTERWIWHPWTHQLVWPPPPRLNR